MRVPADDERGPEPGGGAGVRVGVRAGVQAVSPLRADLLHQGQPQLAHQTRPHGRGQAQQSQEYSLPPLQQDVLKKGQTSKYFYPTNQIFLVPTSS